jgi:hypothetical protein
MPLSMGRVYIVTALTFGALGLVLWLAIGPFPHDSWLRSRAGNQEHALRVLPMASMLQAADSCDPGHFGFDEIYGYWVQDFQHVLRGPNPQAAFTNLAERPETMARMYGLIGLRLLDPQLAARINVDQYWPDTTILVADRCLVESRRVRAVVAEIMAGTWDDRLTRLDVDVH